MPRKPRIVVPGLPHHVTQRGNRRSVTFLDSSDRDVYIRILGSYAHRHDLGIWAYALMSNHVHLIVVPTVESALMSVIRDSHSAYATYFNRKNGTTGHLWQGRFYSCVLDSVHLNNAMRYVERNPVRAGMVSAAEDYPWSSAASHCGLRDDPLLTERIPPGSWPDGWAEWLAVEQPLDEVAYIRRHTQTGRPSGSEKWLIQLEEQLGRRLRPLKRGRRPFVKKGEIGL